MAVRTTHKFEAWRNFLLILSGVLVGGMLQAGQSIPDAVRSVISFNKVLLAQLDNYWVPEIVTLLVVVYFIRVVHGILVALFDKQYVEGLGRSPLRTMVSCILMTLVVISLTFINTIAKLVKEQDTLLMSALSLMGMIAIPAFFFLIFDAYHIWLRYAERKSVGPVASLRAIFAADKEFDDVVNSWFVLDIVSITLLVAWLSYLLLSDDLSGRIIATLVTLGLFLFINSLLDYLLNRGFFFTFLERP